MSNSRSNFTSNSRKRATTSDSDKHKIVTGYVLAVSPLKNSKKSNKAYFNVDLETENVVKSVVCFSPSKRRLFEVAATERTGCEIKNVSVKENDTVFVSDYSTVCKKELGFPRTNMYDFKQINEIVNEVAIDTRVNVVGVLELDEARYVPIGNDEVKIREGHIIDETGNIKITLWREYTEVTSGETYEFLHLVKISYGGDIVLQTINATSYSLSENQIQDYVQPERNAPRKLENARILGMVDNNSHFCLLCPAVAQPKADESLYKCPECANVMLSAMLRKRSVKKFTVSCDGSQYQLNCNNSIITTAFTENTDGMDMDQLQLLLLSRHYDIEFDFSNCKIVKLSPLT